MGKLTALRPTPRLRGRAGQKQRERRLQRTNYLCEDCLAQGIIRLANIVDHIIPHKGDYKLMWDRSNWQPLCKPHHDADKQAIDRGGKPKQRIGVDGWPV